jgi:hypothetical protein
VPLLLLIAVLSLSGCEWGVSSAPQALPPVVEYSPEVQEQAADEIMSLSAESVLADMIADYAVLRAQLRAGGAGT